MSSSIEDAESEMTLTVLGCGTMGIAILSGILSSLHTPPNPMSTSTSIPPSTPGTSNPTYPTSTPSRLPSKFIACVRRPESAQKVQQALSPYLTTTTSSSTSTTLSILLNKNVSTVQESHIILLTCKPHTAPEILSSPGMSLALSGKLLISICAGITTEQLHSSLSTSTSQTQDSAAPSPPSNPHPCTIIRAMPNTASSIRESMTVIATSIPPLPPPTISLLTWIFSRIGQVVFLPPSTMDTCTALCGSGPASQTMKGAAALVLSGEHPALLRDRVSTPGGCTIGGLLVLEEGRVRGTVARAVREATVVAGQLGKGVQGGEWDEILGICDGMGCENLDWKNGNWKI
ncbi:pyrroline-5-carboxylate reductase [Sclerotinia borealis F-4128]|uniref:Pyrroline-5-carboxylate reductase n=1 Tax=Sclerotinia borealis (strain F-4128) TaxID=1432307 RepID=W9CG53_SCLBF|nr:pyrroline-5-carboxylate reductase [Sclerotinia borealis F-4128]